MDIFSILTALDENDELHMARLLLLIAIFSGEEGKTKIKGLTKLAKLDFLLRYPLFLAKALGSKGISDKDLEIKEHEKTSVESKMVRFKYGPWDFRYRRLLNQLAGMGLVDFYVQGNSAEIGITTKGFKLTRTLVEERDEFTDLAKRALILKRHFNKSGTNLKDFIYETFPELTTLRYGDEIAHEF